MSMAPAPSIARLGLFDFGGVIEGEGHRHMERERDIERADYGWRDTELTGILNQHRQTRRPQDKLE